MTAPSGVAPALAVRDATEADNDALVALAAACPMEGDVTLRMDRAPDFFALNRLEGDAWRVGIACDADDRMIGCVAVARRPAWLNGVETTTGYVGDLKVHPRARRSGAADLLSRYAADTSAALCGEDARVLVTILAGNARMERRARGPRGTPVLARFATLEVAAVPLLWERRERVAGLAIRSATDADCEAMAALWGGIAPGRQLAPAVDAASLAAWIGRAPGLTFSDYLLAQDARGRLRGFLGVWDQASFKQMRVVSYSRRLAVARRAINLVAPLAGVAELPTPGNALPALATTHVCANDAATLRALLLEAYRRHRGGRHAFLTLGLDVRDPLRAALRGLLAPPTLVHAYVTSPRGAAEPELLAGLPLHHETALV
ncbi:MAG: GNAT family N-acetyltransferase [Gemmatimonadota bacterium]|nr:GNAT family N-acetyltransferase [Gemmatimonadota bacterium]